MFRKHAAKRHFIYIARQSLDAVAAVVAATAEL
jgi:hypothetical protein